MKYITTVIFKNGLKLDKEYNSRAAAREAAHALVVASVTSESGYVRFAQTLFCMTDVLCVTWQKAVQINEKKEQV